jgi:hypothetical protein
MNIVQGAVRTVTRTADTATAVAGAIGAAAINGVVGGLQGAASGVRNGVAQGSNSPAAAALTIGAIGAAGLVEWPVLLTVGGAALVVHKLSQRSGADAAPPLAAVKTEPAKRAPAKRAPAKKTARR